MSIVTKLQYLAAIWHEVTLRCSDSEGTQIVLHWFPTGNIMRKSLSSYRKKKYKHMKLSQKLPVILT